MSVLIIEFIDRDQAQILGHYHGPDYFKYMQAGDAFWVPQGKPIVLASTCVPLHAATVTMIKDFVRVQAEHVDGFDCTAWTILEAPDYLWELDWWRRT